MKVTVPTELADITLATYMQYEQQETTLGKISVLLGLEESLVRNIEQADFDQITKLLTTLDTSPDQEHTLQPIVEVDGIRYGLIPNLSRITTGEYIDLERLCEDTWTNLPQILAVLYRQVTIETKREYQVAAYTGAEDHTWTQELTMDVVMGVLGFFLSTGLALSSASLQYFREERAAD